MNKRKHSEKTSSSKKQRTLHVKVGDYIKLNSRDERNWHLLVDRYDGFSADLFLFRRHHHHIDLKTKYKNVELYEKDGSLWLHTPSRSPFPAPAKCVKWTKKFKLNQIVLYSYHREAPASYRSIVTEIDGDFVTIQPFGVATFITLHKDSVRLTNSRLPQSGQLSDHPETMQYTPLVKQSKTLEILYATYTNIEENWTCIVVDMDTEFDIYLLQIYQSNRSRIPVYKWVDSEYILTKCVKEKTYNHFEDKNIHMGTIECPNYLNYNERDFNNLNFSYELLQKMLERGDEYFLLQELYSVVPRLISQANDTCGIIPAVYLGAPITHVHGAHPVFNIRRLRSEEGSLKELRTLEKTRMNLSFKKGNQEQCNKMLQRYFCHMDPHNIDMYAHNTRFNELLAVEPKIRLKITSFERHKMKLDIYYRGDMNEMSYFRRKIDAITTTSLFYKMTKYPRLQFIEESHNPNDYKRVFNTHSKWYTSNKVKLLDDLYDYQAMMVHQMLKREEDSTALSNCLHNEIQGVKYNLILGSKNSAITQQPKTGGILSMDVGLGKTVCMIALMVLNPMKTLIVLPLTLMDQWKKEIGKWAGNKLKVTEVHGRKLDYTGDVVLTTYGKLRNLTPIPTHSFKRIVFDESHTITNSKSSTAEAAIAFECPYRWCLSATPITKNSFSTITGQLAMLHVYPFNSKSNIQFEFDDSSKKVSILHHIIDNIFIVQTRKGLDKYGLTYANTSIVKQRVKIDMCSEILYMYTNLWHQIASDVNGITHQTYSKLNQIKNHLQIALVNPSLVPMSYYSTIISSDLGNGIMSFDQYQKQMGNSSYEKQVKDTLTKIESTDCVICMCPLDRPTITSCNHIFCNGCINEQLKHRKKCPCCRKTISSDSLTELVVKQDIEEDGDNIIFNDMIGRKCSISKVLYNKWNESKELESQKMKAVRNIIENTDQSVIIFSQFIPVLKYLKKQLPNSEIITGKNTRKQRGIAIENFQTKKSKIFILSTRCASVGITLTSGSHLIFMEPVIDKSMEKQAIGRLARTGQTQDVHVHTLTVNNSIDGGIMKHFHSSRYDKFENRMLEDGTTGKNLKRAHNFYTADTLVELIRIR